MLKVFGGLHIGKRVVPTQGKTTAVAPVPGSLKTVLTSWTVTFRTDSTAQGTAPMMLTAIRFPTSRTFVSQVLLTEVQVWGPIAARVAQVREIANHGRDVALGWRDRLKQTENNVGTIHNVLVLDVWHIRKATQRQLHTGKVAERRAEGRRAFEGQDRREQIMI